MIARLASFVAAILCLALPIQAHAQQDHWIPLPDGMHVQLLHDTIDPHRIAFLVNLNSYEIASFHVASSLTGTQNYSTEITGWTYYKPGDPFITVTSNSTEYWQFGASSGTFGWQNANNVSNGGNPGYKLIYRLSNNNFTETTTFTYFIDQVPEPSTAAMALMGCAFVGFKVCRRWRQAGTIAVPCQPRFRT
jgi:hypothetical protein